MLKRFRPPQYVYITETNWLFLGKPRFWANVKMLVIGRKLKKGFQVPVGYYVTTVSWAHWRPEIILIPQLMGE